MKWIFISDIYRGKVIMSFPCENEVVQHAAEPYNSQRLSAMDINEMFDAIGMAKSEYQKNFNEYTDFIRRTTSRFCVDVIVPLG